MDTSSELAILALITATLIAFWFKPRYAFHADGSMKSYGLGLDQQGKPKTLFTLPIVLGILSITIQVVAHKLTNP